MCQMTMDILISIVNGSLVFHVLCKVLSTNIELVLKFTFVCILDLIDHVIGVKIIHLSALRRDETAGSSGHTWQCRLGHAKPHTNYCQEITKLIVLTGNMDALLVR